MARDSIAESAAAGGIVIAGAAGVGKSRLAREIVEHAARAQRRCHWLYATTAARSVPLGVFAEFAGSFGADPLRRVHEVIVALTHERAGRGTVVSVDDAHLLDEQSAHVVHQLVLRNAASVVLTMRSGEPAPGAITSLYKDHAIPRLELQPLSAADVAVLLEQTLGGHVEVATAHRLWRYTRGNVLYLRQLIDDEAARGQLSRRSGIWVWTGDPEVSPTLTDLIESNVGRHDPGIVEVIDMVAIADPLELTVLQSLAPAVAIDQAEARGAILIDSAAGFARLAHPLYGEARRKRMGTLQRAALGRRISDAIATLNVPTPQQLVRRAVLLTDRDRPEDAELLTAAATSALHLMDLKLAAALAERAAKCDGSIASRILHGFALFTAARAEEGENVLLEVDALVGDSPERAHMGLIRAASLAWNLGRPDAADAVLDAAQQSAQIYGSAESSDAVRASVMAVRGNMERAAREGARLLHAPDIAPTARMFCAWGTAAALGDLGRLDQLGDMAATEYAYAEAHPETSHLRFGLGVNHIDGLRLAGDLAEMNVHATRLHHQSQDHPASLTIVNLLLGMADVSRGDLVAAQRRFRESLAAYEYVSSVTEYSGHWLAIVHAMEGDHHAARHSLEETPKRVFDTSLVWDPMTPIAQAWINAAAGQVSSAVDTLTKAARLMQDTGRPAREVWCLQTATQFGDTSTSGRLAELARIVQGPRAKAASTHAAGLAAGDGAALLAASRAYEDFGDKVAAADAAAHAAAAFRSAGSRGSALTATATAVRLADDTGADTPALRTATTRAVLTPRQREIISLIAAGFSNRDIAARLHVSVRSVEGHVFRASQRNGVTTRDALAALLGGRSRLG